MLEPGFPEGLKHNVVFQGIVQHQAVLVPVLGDMAQPRLAALMHAGMGNVLAAQGNLSGGGLLQTGQAVDQLCLAVAVDAGDAHNLPGPDLEGHVVDGVFLAVLGVNGHALNVQNHVAGLGLVLFHLQLHRTAHHHIGQLLLVGVLDVHGTHQTAFAQNGTPVRHRHDLVELVGDEQNGLALLGEAPHNLHQFVNLLRGQHCGGFVKDQNFVVPVEHLQNFGTLLHTHGDVLYLGVQIHMELVLFRQCLHLFPGDFPLQEAHFGVLGAQDDVVQHGEHIHQLEMLMNHADVQGRGVIGIVNLHNLPVLLDHACLRLIQAKQNRHQGGFTGAVFTQQRVDLSRFQLQGNVVIGNDTGKLFSDVKHFDNVFRLHKHCPSFPNFTQVYYILPPMELQEKNGFFLFLLNMTLLTGLPRFCSGFSRVLCSLSSRFESK